MRIELLYFNDCPNWMVARDRLDQVVGPDGARVEHRLVTTQAEAEEVGFQGSPTILIDGDDPFATDEPFGLSCRIYQTPDGPAGAPTVAQLAAAIKGQESQSGGTTP